MVASQGGQASLFGRTLGNYAVKALIGRGAMGAVYLAQDMTLGRSVALKVMLGSMARNPRQVEEFQMEAQAAAPLQHPNVVGVYEAGVIDGTPFIAMEYVEGEPLERFMRRHGALPWQNALHIAQQVLAALDCAHRAGVVHCDVKPSNILLDRRGRVRLTDFGIAKARQGPGARAGSGAFLGTPRYMSPEQCGTWAQITPASDLFSLGVTLYQMIANRLPFEGETTHELVNAIAFEDPVRLNQVMMGVPDDVARLVAHLLEKDPRRRPRSARSVAKTIERIHREDGGKSALPDALNAFIREQAQPRHVTGNTPVPGRRKTRGSRTSASSLSEDPRDSVSFVSRVLVAAFFACALLGAGYWHYVRPARRPPPAPELFEAAFAAGDNGVVTVLLPGALWEVDRFHWVGDRPVLAVAVRGRSGSPALGAAGLLSIDPESRSVRSLEAPAGPMSDAAFWEAHVPGPSLSPIPRVSKASPFRDMVLRQAFAGSGRHERGLVLTVAQKWDEATPRSKPLYQARAPEWNPRILSPWAPQEAGQALLSPDGHTLCLLLFDTRTATTYLAERDTRWRASGRVGPRRTTAGDPILAGSLQYSPDGAYIAYMRHKSAAERELWLMRSGGSETNGRPLTLGRLDTAAFSADGARIAVGTGPDTATRIDLFHVSDGVRAGDLGAGRLTTESFHPSGRYLVCVAPEPDTGLNQLWAVDTAAPFTRRQLTHIEGGVRRGGAVSRDGRWVVGTAETRDGAALVFVRLRATQFEI